MQPGTLEPDGLASCGASTGELMKQKGDTGKKMAVNSGAGSRTSTDRLALWSVAASPLLQLAIVALVGILAYSNTFHVPFVIDDEGSIVENHVVKNLASFLFDGDGYRYNPRRFIGYLTLALNYAAGGLDVTGYHLFNTAVHLANAALVFVLLRLTLKAPIFQAPSDPSSAGTPPQAPAGFLQLAPFLAALLFVAHPIQTQAVTYVVQRVASLATMFYLASLLFYAQARLRQESAGTLYHGKAVLFHVAALAAAALAMKTKEISFTLPIAVALYEFSFFGATLRKRMLFLLPIAVTLVIVPLGLLHAGKPVGDLLGEMSAMARETTAISRTDYLLTQFGVIATYLRLLVFPVRQNLDYDYPVYHTPFAPAVLGGFLLLLALFASGVYLYRRSAGPGAGKVEPSLRLAAFGIFWFFITLSVESSIIPIRDVIFEHRVYLPSVGIFTAVAALCAAFAAGIKPRSGAVALTCVVLVLASLTWKRNLVWGSAVTLWQDTALKSPQKVRPHNNLANALIAEGRVDEAIEELKLARKLEPDNADTLRNLGAAYEKKGGVDQAIEQYGVALRTNPNNKYAHYNLGVAYNKKGLADLAVAEFLIAVKLDPTYAEAHNNLGVTYGNKGMFDQAIREFELAVSLDPGSADAHHNLGFALGKSGQAEKALGELRQAAALQPGNAEVYNNLGIVYANEKRFKEAAEQFRKAAAIKPDDQRYLNNLYRLQLQTR
ncbi:MAG TPA: tetratricopeptide repeat-containing protein [Geobacter sp.]|nr:tetratricopeptide repeat-containing protein [Geobacter sp.]